MRGSPFAGELRLFLCHNENQLIVKAGAIQAPSDLNISTYKIYGKGMAMRCFLF